MSLKARAVRHLGATLIFLAAILLVPGSLRFWQGWMFLALTTGFWTFFLLDLMKRDSRLIERRLQNQETEPRQKLFQKLFLAITLPGFFLTGLDFRFGWSRRWPGPVPVPVVVAAQVAVVAAYWIVFWVMRTNTFAGSTILVEAGQKVIHAGPYAFVRHPMYSGMAVIALAAPLALGSYVALPVFALLVPSLVYRLIHEEKTLGRDLTGYSDYCGRVRFRLLPWLW
jgi:protein-S-isoprenylcysteine O-methyltransferase Ste14